tara:strand:- start:527 stop:1036 length:510 start_codon:yes stop_codon:yes gene_type:complete
MAQTISAQRGSTSIAINTFSTLYTNSSSGSSRVIINAFGLFTTTGDVTFIASGLYLTNSAGGFSIPVAIARTTMASQYNHIYVPGSIPVGSAVNTNGTGFVILVNRSNQSSTAPNEMQWSYSGTAVVDPIHYCPKSIWMGPSDVLSVRQTNGNGANMTANYNFTVITET